MQTATALTGIILTILSVLPDSTPALEASTASAARPQASAYTFTGFTERHHEIVDWAMGLFADAGLDLPSIDFIASVDREPCRDRIGIARHRDSGSEITICGERISPAHDIVVVHELAHAWEKHNSTHEAREAFLELRGLTEWRSGDWHDRGAEHAADIITWGLMDRPYAPGHLDFDGCDELFDGYRTIVGAEPLHGFTDKCDA